MLGKSLIIRGKNKRVWGEEVGRVQVERGRGAVVLVGWWGTRLPKEQRDGQESGPGTNSPPPHSLSLQETPVTDGEDVFCFCQTGELFCDKVLVEVGEGLKIQ